jgi:hypothetical protein
LIFSVVFFFGDFLVIFNEFSMETSKKYLNTKIRIFLNFEKFYWWHEYNFRKKKIQFRNYGRNLENSINKWIHEYSQYLTLISKNLNFFWNFRISKFKFLFRNSISESSRNIKKSLNFPLKIGFCKSFSKNCRKCRKNVFMYSPNFFFEIPLYFRKITVTSIIPTFF